MSKIIISLCIGLVAGFFLSPFLAGERSPDLLEAPQQEPVAAVECVCDMQRTLELERALKVERDTNNLLVAEIDQLQSEIDSLASREPAESSGAGDWLENAWADLAAGEESPDRQQMLIDAGFSAARAARILERESQLQMLTLEEHQRDAPKAQPLSYLESRFAARRALREELGDYEYEQYLAATGQSTAVAVTQVLGDSPAQSAGLKVGDEIVDYDGVRVFNMLELSDQARTGDRNEAVVLNIQRNGSPMQLVLPGGPLGISGGKPTRP